MILKPGDEGYNRVLRRHNENGGGREVNVDGVNWRAIQDNDHLNFVSLADTTFGTINGMYGSTSHIPTGPGSSNRD